MGTPGRLGPGPPDPAASPVPPAPQPTPSPLWQFGAWRGAQVRFVSWKVKEQPNCKHRHALEGLEVSRERGHTWPRSSGSQADSEATVVPPAACPHEAATPPWPKATLSCRVPFPETRNGLHWWFCIRLGGPRVQAPAPGRGRLTGRGCACPPPAPCLSCGSGPRMP